MKPLNKMAAEVFHGFAALENKPADWNYLSNTRKLAWIKDTLLIAKYFMIQLQKEVKPLPPGNLTASYGMGFVAGQRSERMSFLALIEQLYEDLEQQYDELHDELQEKQ